MNCFFGTKETIIKLYLLYKICYFVNNENLGVIKLRYTEEKIVNAIKRLQLEHSIPEDIKTRPIKYPLIANLIRSNGTKASTNCAIDSNDKGILVILLHTFKPEKIIGYQYFKFSDIQDIKIKRVLLTVKISLQFVDGTKYVFRVTRKNLKYFPHQKDNLEKIISILESKGLSAMKNPIYKKNFIKNKIFSLFYGVTLLLFEFITMLYINENLKTVMENKFLFILSGLLVFAIHCIIFTFFVTAIKYLRDIKFINAYTPIIRKYEQTKDVNQLLKSLLAIKKLPKTQNKKNIYYLGLSAAYSKCNNNIEARNILLKIKTKDLEMAELVKRQLQLIEENV